MKRLLSTAAVAFLAALLITWLYRPAPLEQQLLHLQVQQTMPQYARTLAGEPAALQALFLAYHNDPVLLAKARLTMLRHPDIARPILLAYGDDPVFQNVLRTYGDDVVLPIHYFMSNEVLTLELMRRVGDATRSALDAARSLWPEGPPAEAPSVEPMPPSSANQPSIPMPTEEQTPAPGPAQPPGALSPEERGRHAIHFLYHEGYDFLGQFVLAPDGRVAWVQTERVLEGINRFFAGGIRGLETKLRRDEPVGVGDVGWAALDVAVGVAAFKMLRLGAGSATSGRTLTFSQRSAALGAGLWRGTVVGARVVKYGAPAVLAYMAIRHPSIINSLLGSAAEKLGLPVDVVQVAGWTLLLLPVLLVLRFLLRPLAWLLAALAGLLRWGHGATRARAVQYW